MPSAQVVARAARGLSWRDARREILDELVDEVEASDRAIAIAQARRIRAIEAVRIASVTSVVALDPTLGPVDPADSVRTAEIRAQQRFAHRGAVLEVSCALRTAETRTAALVHEAEVLVDHHPATLAALSEGQISYAHAGVVLENTTTLDPDDCRALESTLVERAKDSTVATLRRFARRERERTHPRPVLERHRERLAERHVEIEPARDGMMWLHQYLPAVQAAAIYNRLTDTAVSFQGPDEDRTLGQLRADVFSALLLDDVSHAAWEPARSAVWAQEALAGAGAGAGASAGTGAAAGADAGSAVSAGPSVGAEPEPEADAGDAALIHRGVEMAALPGIGPSLRGIRPVVAVTVPVMTLLGRSDEPGHLEGYGPIDAETARDLAARAPSFRRLLTHPESGVVLSVGRQRYTVPADLRSWLRIRDETCRFPGCNRRAQRCDVDHITPWQMGGTTDHHNLIHLCRHHHRVKHETAWTVSASDRGGSPDVFARPGSVTWTSPAGRTYIDHPALPRPSRLPEQSAPRIEASTVPPVERGQSEVQASLHAGAGAGAGRGARAGARGGARAGAGPWAGVGAGTCPGIGGDAGGTAVEPCFPDLPPF